ncbi:MAG: ATP-binding protein [Pseudomonadota bacterium]
MASTRAHNTVGLKGAFSREGRHRLKRVLLALIVVQAIALGLKAWQDRIEADKAARALLATEASLIAQRLDARIGEVATILDLNDSRRNASDAMPGEEIVLRASDAAQSPAGSRLRAAADRAGALIDAGQRSGLSADGDLVIVSGATDNPLIAIERVESYIPAPGNDHRIAFNDGISIGRGASTLDSVFSGNASQTIGLGWQMIASQACRNLPASGITACVQVERPRFDTDTLVALVIYGLLFAAPALAIGGLLARLADQAEFDDALVAQEAETARMMALVTDGAEVGYWELYDDKGAIWLSERALTLLQKPPDEQTAPTLATLSGWIDPQDREQVSNALAECASLGWVHVRFRVGSGEPARWLELRGSVTPGTGAALEGGGAGSGIGGIIVDVTEQKQSEDRFQAAENRLRSAIETFSGPFALWDKRRRLVYWNQAYASAFRLSDTLRPGASHDAVAVAMSAAIARETEDSFDGGSTLFGLKSGKFIRLVEKPTPEGGLISVGVDVTDTERSQTQLGKQQDRLRELVKELERSEGHAAEMAKKYAEEKARAQHAAATKSAFLANMSHELRTPLNAINGFSEIIASELYGPLGDAKYKAYANDILASGQHLLDMINEILDMAKIEAGKMTIDPRPIDIVDPVDAAVRMIRRRAEEKGVELTLTAEDNLPDVAADHRAIRQMVLNLVSNAVKFTDEGGRVVVGVRRQDGMVQVAVRDSGRGISKEDLPRLAQPFEQVKGDQSSAGTGLGLALTKSFAEMHGGALTIKSQIGKGTMVSFVLPFADDVSADQRPDDLSMVPPSAPAPL